MTVYCKINDVLKEIRRETKGEIEKKEDKDILMNYLSIPAGYVSDLFV